MKNILLLLVLVFGLVSCEKSSTMEISSYDLPPELEGLVIYKIPTGIGLTSVRVAVLNKEINSLNYSSGKTNKDVFLINKKTNDVIFVKEILIDNDTLIVARK